MSHEIVPVDPIDVPSTSYSRPVLGDDDDSPERHQFTKSLTFREHVSSSEPFDSERLPATLASEIQRFLRIANLVESEEPRIAYLCRFHAFEIAHHMDRNSTGRGVRQFKTSLLQRLEQDEEFTVRRRKEKSDVRELKRVYHAYKEYIIRHGAAFNLDNSQREKLINARRIASVLYEVLKTVTSGAGPQAIADRDSIRAKSEFYVPYNILPLDKGGVHQAIMHLPEIKAAVAIVRNTRGLPPPEDFQRHQPFVDLFEFLQYAFGFQNGNVANQREHLILLLSNTIIRQPQKQSSAPKSGDEAVDALMKKFFKNYTNWCKFLGRKNNIRLPYVKQEALQYKTLYIGLYLLIWGEASNLRFMPECLCYIFHHMAYELHGVLTGAVSMITGEKVMPAYGVGHESFLANVVTPIYRVVEKEADKNKNGTADHSMWRNYDDLNEFFWSSECFEIGWPMRVNQGDGEECFDGQCQHDFFCVESSDTSKTERWRGMLRFRKQTKKTDEEIEDAEELGGLSEEQTKPTSKWLGKTNFVETRSFWQIFRSFDRMWSFFVLSLQALIIMACHDVGSPLQMFNANIFEDVMSIFITSAILNLIKGILDIIFKWKARNTMPINEKKKQMVKLGFAAIWTIILPVLYAHSRRKYICYFTDYKTWLGEWCFSPYMVAVTIYLTGSAIKLVLFFVPAISKYIETSNHRIFKTLSWWGQPRLYVGRGVQETQMSQFNYAFEIKPLIEPTRLIMKVGVRNYEWHEIFPEVKSNAAAIVAVWAPIMVVYFMDTQIWYSVYCTIFGGLYGVLHHLGEIRTLGMLRGRFHTLPSAFNACLIPHSTKDEKRRKQRGFFPFSLGRGSDGQKNSMAKFVLVWNQVINSFRTEDLISNKELDLMTMPMSSEVLSGIIRWPIFLLANKFSTALSITKDFVGKDEVLYRRIRKDEYMYYAVKECYESLKYILQILVVGDLEKKIISGIINEIEENIRQSSLLEEFKMTELPALHDKCIELVQLLVEGSEERLQIEKSEELHGKLVKALQDIFELVTNDMMVHGDRILDLLKSQEGSEEDTDIFMRVIEPQLFESYGEHRCIHFPLPDSASLSEQIQRFLLLLTVKDSAMDIPENLEARRRISFFATSLFMDMPDAPKVRNMMSFSVLTPHYQEDINFSTKELHSTNSSVSIIFYMQKIFPDEWKNFLERMGCDNLDSLKKEGKEEELRSWASFRGQTLSRTVRGMMYCREALKLQAFLDMADDEDLLEGYNDVERSNRPLAAQLDALADMKFTYVVSCQMFGAQKSAGDPHAQDILDLMIKYPSLRVAYVEEREEIVLDVPKKVYYSILVKAVNGFDQEIYRVKLPGPPNIGEGKPENQNHAIVFTRGEALQTIDMNQDHYLEEAFKMRNLLQEFLRNRGRRPPTILGLREHIFTGSVSSLAWFMSYQETSFVTIGQRLLANPLRVRFHYGHPDVFDRIFHIARGGISKASRTINLSEDVFAGYNTTLRRGCITYNEYLQVGKGRDVGLNQISKFEAKVANGNSEQTISRDIYRLGQRFDFFRMLSCYFTTIGFYFSSLISVIGIYIYLYGQLYLVLSGLQKTLILEAKVKNIKSLETALASQSFIQLGLLTGLPMVMEIGLEKGFLIAFQDFILMQLQLAAFFFTFSLGTKTHYFGRTILHGGAKYRPTGRKVVVFHANFSENYRLYSRSHFIKGFELMILLVVYELFKHTSQSNMAYSFITFSVWFMSLTWLCAPFLFNPSGFTWEIIVGDWRDWNRWIKEQGGIGIQQDKSWQSWWNEEQAHLRGSGVGARCLEIILSLRFFVYQYGLVYHLDISQSSTNIIVYALSWVVILATFFTVKAVDLGRQLFSTRKHLLFRFFKVFIFVSILTVIITLSNICHLSIKDLIVSCLAFLPTGWGLILMAQAVRPKIEGTSLWEFAQVLARAYDYGMGVVLFAPMAILAWLPIISAFQTRFLFNEAFNRRLQIQPILAGKKKNR
ncbi:PREDICTED: putative callose synthase 8 isoform X3 [Camelina sativa]|uniref:1,3-beta-glucan synthase n=1 Tax=Camelina sativa TaxID=90675 RepID=A0ABM1RS30_CAMSA|nr:PREDICTED: putative callose synthase 8 isoform X3 [Camelina sativa]